MHLSFHAICDLKVGTKIAEDYHGMTIESIVVSAPEQKHSFRLGEQVSFKSKKVLDDTEVEYLFTKSRMHYCPKVRIA